MKTYTTNQIHELSDRQLRRLATQPDQNVVAVTYHGIPGTSMESLHEYVRNEQHARSNQ